MNISLKLNKVYLFLLLLFTLFIAIIFTFFTTLIFTAVFFAQLEQLSGIFGEQAVFGILFFSILLGTWGIMMAYFLSKEIILTEDNIIFKNLFGQKKVSVSSIVDWSSRVYVGSRTEAFIGDVLGDLKKVPTKGTVLEIWYKNNGKIDYHEENVTSFSNIEKLLTFLSNNVQLNQRVQTETRSLVFYIKTHKFYVGFVTFITLSFIGMVIVAVISNQEFRTAEFISFAFFGLLVPALAWFFIGRDFFRRR